MKAITEWISTATVRTINALFICFCIAIALFGVWLVLGSFFSLVALGYRARGGWGVILGMVIFLVLGILRLKCHRHLYDGMDVFKRTLPDFHPIWEFFLEVVLGWLGPVGTLLAFASKEFESD